MVAHMDIQKDKRTTYIGQHGTCMRIEYTTDAFFATLSTYSLDFYINFCAELNYRNTQR